MRHSRSTSNVLQRRTSPHRFAAAVVGALTLGGCMSWQRQHEQPRDLLARHPPTAIRVVDHTGGRMLLHKPFVSGDSLGGYRDSAGADGRYVVPMQDVAYVEVERVDAGKSVLALAAVGATVALVAAVADAANDVRSARSSAPSDMNMKFSCPLVYSWDGRHWRLDSGTFGGAIVEALQRTDLDNLDFASVEDGVLRLRVANELRETDHLDALAVVAVDHDPSLAVAPDPAGGIHTIGVPEPPLRATDFRGADALARVREADGWTWESAVTGRDAIRPADLRDGLELAFARPHGATRAHLVLDANSSVWGTYLLGEFIRSHGRATEAWYDAMNAHPAGARAVQARLAREAFLAASVRTASGWTAQGLFWEAGPEIVKRQVLDLDLSRVTGDTVLVRLASAPAFWTIDRVAIDWTSDQAVTVHELPLVAARDRLGRDVGPLIGAVDHREYVLASGAAAEVTFAVPPLPAGRSRSFLLRSTGWYRVDSPETGEPDAVALGALARDSLAVGRASVLRLTAALAQFAEHRR